jgi:hypothetical protein
MSSKQVSSTIETVFFTWSVPSLYKKQWRLLERIRQEVVQSSSVVDVLTLKVLTIVVCHRYSYHESIIMNSNYDMWNYPINWVIKCGTHYLLSCYQDTCDSTFILPYPFCCSCYWWMLQNCRMKIVLWLCFWDDILIISNFSRILF